MTKKRVWNAGCWVWGKAKKNKKIFSTWNLRIRDCLDSERNKTVPLAYARGTDARWGRAVGRTPSASFFLSNDAVNGNKKYFRYGMMRF